MKEFLTEVKEEDLGKVLENVSLQEYTTYKIGGIARALVFPKSVEALVQIIKKIRSYDLKSMVLGNGSNVLFSDEAYEGVIIKLDALNDITIEREVLTAGAGASLMKAALLSIRKGYSGLEFATGIPGTIGGAVYMNAGAYKSDMGYVVRKVKVLTPDLRVITMVNGELDFHYRTSFFKEHKDYICLEATIQLKKGNKEEIEELVRDRKRRRLESQPLEYPSAGSVFRNPELAPAGKLIEDLGFKGLVKGGAQISEKHANFIINCNHAKAEDVRSLIEFVQSQVKDHYGVDLKVEQEFMNWE